MNRCWKIQQLEILIIVNKSEVYFLLFAQPRRQILENEERKGEGVKLSINVLYFISRSTSRSLFASLTQPSLLVTILHKVLRTDLGINDLMIIIWLCIGEKKTRQETHEMKKLSPHHLFFPFLSKYTNPNVTNLEIKRTKLTHHSNARFSSEKKLIRELDELISSVSDSLPKDVLN